MSKFTIHFKDVTRDPTALERIGANQDLRDELLASGFAPVGLLEVAAAGDLAGPQLDNMVAGPDSELLRQATKQGEIDEVLRSPDRKSFVLIDKYFDGPLLVFRTVLENGLVVETTMQPRRAPQIEFLPLGTAGGGLLGNLMNKLMNLALPKPPLWVRENWPSAGYFLELVAERRVRALWKRHGERVSQIQQQHNASIPPHDNLDLQVSINRRAYHIVEYKARLGQVLDWALIGVFVVGSFGVVQLPWRTLLDEVLVIPELRMFGLLAPLLLLLFVNILMFPLLGFVKNIVVPHLPGPKLQPVAELLSKYSLSAVGH